MANYKHVENTGTHFLGAGQWDLCASTTRAFVFGHIVKCTTPYLTAYWSDLFHDAAWIAKYLVDSPTDSPLTFYVGTGHDGFGTHIGTDEKLIAQYTDHTWCFTVRDFNAGTSKFTGKWVVDITKRTEQGDYTLVLDAVSA